LAPGKNGETLPEKYLKQKRGGGMAQVIECLQGPEFKSQYLKKMVMAKGRLL
jgi:hypothetical protein